jgi:DUF4097 and DUF4098 domain-containing protein YvlB
MQVPNDARYNVDLHSGSGGIHVNHTLLTQGSMDKHHITGSVNGGGPTVRAQTGSGSVTID